MSGRNPPYNYALGAANQSGAPPFDLSQVIMRVFPLRANYHSLQLFCDRFINIAPHYSHFEPAAPFVLFCAINYGHMGNVASNLGYTSQTEILFAVPLNWYRKVGDQWKLESPASISPFIWVDQPASAWTGRNVFGWPKSIAWLTPGLSEWMKDPTGPRTVMALSALMYRRLFAGERQEPSLLLEIEQQHPSALFDLPPNTLNPLNPWLSWPQALLRSLSLGGTLFETMTRLPTFGYAPWGNGANVLDMMAATFGDFNPVGALPAQNTINLKQFRQPTHPQSVSYQAIVNSKMTPKSFTRGGLLGEPGLFRGDLAGGYRIRIHRHPGWPIIESLGLSVSQEHTEGDHTISVLEPVFPFWVEVDFEYGEGDVICWRTRDSHWSPPPRPDEAPALELTSVRERALNEFRCDECDSPHLYNTAEGSAVQQVYGPFDFPGATVRVLPLMATWEKLRTFTDAYLNFPDGSGETKVDRFGALETWQESDRPAPPDYKLGMPKTECTASGDLFIPWGRYVYLTITSYEEITSQLNIGWWAKRRVTFSYPVKWYQWVDTEGQDPHWALKSFGVISPFMYVDTSTAATVGREMQGWNVAEADIECPRTTWLDGDGPIGRPELMALYTDVLPAINADQKTRKELLVEVTMRDPVEGYDTEDWNEVVAKWGEGFVWEAKAKATEADPTPYVDGWTPRRKLTWLKSSAMEILFRRQPVNHIALKQFRDAKDPDEACLQAINVYPESIERVLDLRSIDDVLHVAVHRYPTQPIVELFGLDVKWTDHGRGQPVDYLQAVRPFWMRADIKAHLGRDVRWRAGSTGWVRGEDDRLYFDELEQLATPAGAAAIADEHPRDVQNFGQLQWYARALEDSLAKWGFSDWSYTRRGHAELLRQPRVSFSPQVAIESILAHRWADFGPEPPFAAEERGGAWRTLIPKASIANDEAAEKFLEDFGYHETQRDADSLDVVHDHEKGPYWTVDPEWGHPEDLPPGAVPWAVVLRAIGDRVLQEVPKNARKAPGAEESADPDEPAASSRKKGASRGTGGPEKRPTRKKATSKKAPTKKAAPRKKAPTKKAAPRKKAPKKKGGQKEP